MSSGRQEVDMELKKAFQEQHDKQLYTQQHLKQADAQLESCKRAELHANLVMKEVENNEAQHPNIRLFESVGRTFILRPNKELKADLVEKVKTSKEKAVQIQKQKQKLEQSLKESEDALRELIHQKRSTSG